MAISDILFRISTDTTAFQASMGKVNSELNKVFNAANRATSGFAQLGARMTSMGSTLTVGVTAPIVAFGGAVVKTAADMEALKAGLAATTKETGPLEAQLRRLQDVAKLPGLGLREAIQGSTNLQAAGFSANLAERSLKAFGNALATVGKGKSDLDGVTLALSQIASKGKISAEEINQLAERVPQIRVAIKDAFGTADTEVLQKAGIGAEEFVTRVVAQLEKLKTVTGGTKNSFENLSDTLTQSGDRIGQKFLPVVNELIPKIERVIVLGADLADEFTKLPPMVQNTALAFVGIAASTGPISYAFGRILAVAGSLRIGIAALASGISAVGIASAAAGVGVGLFMKWLIDNGQKPVDTTAEAIKKLNEKAGTGTPAAFGSATEAVLGYMRVMAPANVATGDAETKHLAVAAAIEKHRTALESAKLPSFELQVLTERLARAHTAQRNAVGEAADILFRYNAVTMEQARLTAEAEQAVFKYYRTLSAAPDMAAGLKIDFSKLPKAPSAGLPGPGGFEDFVRSGKNIGPEGMLTKEQAEAIKARYKDTSKAAQAAMKQVSTIVTDLSRGIAGIIFEGGKFGDMLQKIAKQAGQAIVRELIEGALTKLTKKLFDVGGLFGKVFGGASGAAGSAGGTIFSAAGSAGSSAAGSIGSGASSAVGAASSSIAGIVGAVGSVVSAISGVIGNFQFMAMNKSLDLIEHEVRYSQIHLSYILAKQNEYLPKLKDIWDSLIRMETSGAALAGGGGQINVNMAGAFLMSDSQMNDFADRLVRFIKPKL